MVDITNILGDGWQKSTANFDPPEVQLADAMRQAGIEPPPNISLDGQLQLKAARKMILVGTLHLMMVFLLVGLVVGVMVLK